jgi:DNA-binding NarL/FixJ family response regulator
MARRRQQVLTLSKKGKTQQEIVDLLSVSVETIKRDTKALNGKWGGLHWAGQYR